MTGTQFWGYIHIMLLVFWLGADIGVFISAKIAKTTKYPVETRAALLTTAGIVDLFPRYCFALIFASGLSLVDAMGLYSPPLWALVLAWVVGGIWVWAIWQAHCNPAAAWIKVYMKVQFWGEAVAGTALLAAAAASFATGSPVAEKWLAAKILLLGVMFFVAMTLEVVARPFGVAFGEIKSQGSTPEREARANAAMNNTLTVVGVIYAILFVVALIGRVKPF
ncbi:MAG: hypothetical protein FJX59_01920 [Alphaproteobacteria bacterium]|nr:hypothetical protein [Alphaproteobacteria bacterium]